MRRDIGELRKVLSYDPETGVVAWKAKPSRNIRVGAPVGSVSRGYLKTRVRGTEYMVHRLAWALHYGQWPEHEIDHINGVKSDNRIANLRDVPRKVNAQNIRRPKANNKAGAIGVVLDHGRYSARITIDGRCRHIGMFGTLDEAHQAYLNVKRQLHEGNTL